MALRSSSASKSAGKYSRRERRSHWVRRVCSQIRLQCTRAKTLITAASELSPAAAGANRCRPYRPTRVHRRRRAWRPKHCCAPGNEQPEPDSRRFRVASSCQRRHPRARFGLDADRRVRPFDVVLKLVTGQRTQPGNTGHSYRKPSGAMSAPAESISSTAWEFRTESSPTTATPVHFPASVVCHYVRHRAGEPSHTRPSAWPVRVQSRTGCGAWCCESK